MKRLLRWFEGWDVLKGCFQRSWDTVPSVETPCLVWLYHTRNGKRWWPI